MPKHSPIWQEFGQVDSETGLDFLACPDCDGKRFYTLAEFKSHRQRKHGGIAVSGSDVESIETDSQSTPNGNANTPSASVSTASAPPKAKRLSAKARELNDKLNEAINLVIKHFIDGLTETEVERLGTLRGEVSTAVIGVEFDFESRLFAVSGKIALAITVGCLYVLPKLPTLKQMHDKAKEKQAKNATE